MQSIYQHRQTGTAMLVIVGIPMIGLLAGIAAVGRPAPMIPMIFVLAILLATLLAFRSLTVQVDAEQVTLYFGAHFWKRSFPVRQIREVRVVRNAIWHGLGIHFIRGGMIYNVSGLDGVEINLENGKRYRIGSDEPAALAQAIESAMRLHRRA